MASTSSSNPKVSGYSIYTRSRAKREKLNMDFKEVSVGRVDANKIVSRAVSKRQSLKKIRGREEKVVEVKTPGVESPHSDGEQKFEPEKAENTSEKDDVSMCFEPSTSSYIDVIERCGKEAVVELLQWLLKGPTEPEVFFAEKWEKQPFLIQRLNGDYYSGLYSIKEFEKAVNENDLHYDTEIDVVAYVDGERKTLKNDIRVLPSFLWGAFKEGYSIRMRNSQLYTKSLESLCSLLEEYFSSYVDANMYLTPADTQGFPPHYDDTDAFILQIEGKKLWKLYAPSEREMLARHSNPDLSETEIGEPCMEVELHPGDMLYFPRGYIHQAKAAPGIHSLHLNLSVSQLNTWGNFLQHALSNALNEAVEYDIEFRKSIPTDYLDYMGQVHSDTDSKERQDFQKKAFSLIEKAYEYVSLDYAADAHGIVFIHRAVPPFLTSPEKFCSVHWNGACIEDGRALVSQELNFNTKIRLIRKRAFKLVMDVNGTRLYYSLFNTKDRKQKEVDCIEVDPEDVPALIALFKAYPAYIKVKDLPHGNSAQLMACLQPLYDNGFLLTEERVPFDE
ncbi:Ribosomal oxygenase 1 [Araneus ventricosus]|uniref:Bifunctional lysine-specific demethylase and histidyl-hydroxylase n=1 Tax=Araneus ventricosus TaxID=182803 RepID=A0A4Y2B0K7_ARAVE|nr:Ribosomal oxygenase 1 [Araneus ventricosus]